MHAAQVQTSENQELGYNREIVAIIELIYGQNMLSQGGTAKIEEMFSGIDLNGKKALDIGSGLGGVDFYLAQNYAIDITGIDPENFIVNDAHKRLEQLKQSQSFKGSVMFQHHTRGCSLSQFADNTFDIVFSKEALLHVDFDQKAAYLKEMYRVLKPGGKLVILDWLHTSPDYSVDVHEMMTIDAIAYNLITPQEYTQQLETAGFSNICFADLTEQYKNLTSDDCRKVEETKQAIVELFGDETYRAYLKSWRIQLKAMADREILVCSFRAQK